MDETAFSLREQLVLLLDECGHELTGITAPGELTQKGAARVLAVTVPTVSRLLKQLSDEGLVASRTAHIAGERKRCQAYYLSSKARVATEGLLQQFRQVQVCLNHDGRSREVPLHHLNNLLGTAMFRPELLRFGRRSSASQQPASRPVGNGMRMLVVDDEPSDRRSLCRNLRRIGIEAQVDESVDYVSGRAALEAHNYRVAFVDHDMPGPSGIELLKWIQDRPSKPRVIYVTANVDPRIILQAFRTGASDFLIKGEYTRDELQNSIVGSTAG